MPTSPRRGRKAADDAARAHTANANDIAADTDAASSPSTDHIRSAWQRIADARPTDRASLAAWLARFLALRLPDRPLIAHHAAPLDYLCFAFFEDTPAPSRDCVVWANRGGGKTFLAAVATLLDLLYKPGIEIRILGGSLEQSKRVHAHLRALIHRHPFPLLIDGKLTQTRLALSNGSAVELLAQSQTSVRGTRVQKLRCDEVELFDPEVWEAAQLATREKLCGHTLVRGSIECLSTMHRPYGLMHSLVADARTASPARALFRWGVVDVLAHCDDTHHCSRPDHADCPLLPECKGRAKLRAPDAAGHISVPEALRLKSRVSDAQWKSEMLCLRPRRRDCVLPEFDPAVHVFDEDHLAGLPAHLRADFTFLCGLDFGIRSPTVVLFAALDPLNTLRILDERVREDEPLSAHARAILDAPWPKPLWIAVDPAGRARSIQTGISDIQALARTGLDIKSRALPRDAGLELLRARLRPADKAPPRLLVHRRCQRLIESMEKYHYPADRPDTLEPVKDGSDHAVDALRYLVQNIDAPYRTTHSKYTK
jgi:hypothetical protein